MSDGGDGQAGASPNQPGVLRTRLPGLAIEASFSAPAWRAAQASAGSTLSAVPMPRTEEPMS